MNRPASPHHQEVTKRLLEQGARSYLQAATALLAYEREVQKLCRRAMEAHFDEYVDALAIPLDLAEIQDGAWEPDGLEEDWRSVGVAIEGKRIPPLKRWWGVYCCLYWDAAHPGQFQCGINEWIGGPRKNAEDILRRFRKSNSEVWGEGKEIGVCRWLAADAVDDAEDTLGELFKDWIGLWQKVGG